MALPRICLCMIVKDEAAVIARCLRSVKPLIDTWCIVDTGSTDDTQAVIRRELAGIPGALVERPWVNFAHNRNEAMDCAAGDYLLLIDADDVLEVAEDDALDHLTADSYELQVEYAGTLYQRKHLVRAGAGYRWGGVVHEALIEPPGAVAGGLVKGITYRCIGGSARQRDPKRFLRDAKLLARALHHNPRDTRSAFYLAQSWRDAGELEKALAAYLRRSDMGGWVEEVYVALREAGRLAERLKRDPVAHWLRAAELVPARAETLYELARFYRARRAWRLGYAFASAALDVGDPPSGALFVEASVYAWRARDEQAVCAYWLGRRAEARELNSALLADPALAADHRQRIEQNMWFCNNGGAA